MKRFYGILIGAFGARHVHSFPNPRLRDEWVSRNPHFRYAVRADNVHVKNTEPEQMVQHKPLPWARIPASELPNYKVRFF